MNAEQSHVADLLAEACGCPRQRILQSADLVEDGLLDSLGMINLFAALEDEGIELQPTQVPMQSLRTVEGITALVRRAREEAGQI